MTDSQLESLAKAGRQTDFFNEWTTMHPGATGADTSAAYIFFATNKSSSTTGSGAAAAGSSSSSSGRYSSGIGGGSDGIITKILKAGGTTPTGASGTWVGLDDISRAITLQNIFNAFRHPLNLVGSIMDTIGDNIAEYYERQKSLYETINQQTGIMNEMGIGLRKEITESIPRASELGISFQEMASSVTDMTVESGRFKLIDQQTIERVMLASKFVGTMNETMKMMPNFQNVSMGVADATEAINRSGLSSLKLGLNARETVKTLSTNLEKMNQFGFKNGIEGLNRMVQKAQELRMSMDTVLGIADKVMDPEKALEMSANLQVIGGALGDFNDPIKMMYMSTNNVEGLNDALAKSAESLVTFNQEQGRFQIFGGDLRRAKAMASELGISYTELSNIAIQSAQRTAAATDILNSGLNVNEDDREFITNLAQMKEGKMVIEIPQNLRDQFKLIGDQTNISLETLTGPQLEILKAQKEQLEDMGMEELAQKQFSLISNINNTLNSIKDTIMIRAGALVSQGIDQVGGTITKKNEIIKSLHEMAGDVNENIGTVTGEWSQYLKELSLPTSVKAKTAKQPIPIGSPTPPSSPAKTPVPKTSTKTGPTAYTPTTKKFELTINASGPIMDPIARELLKKQEFFKEPVGSFLENLV